MGGQASPGDTAKTAELTVASVEVSRGLSFYPRPCISPSAWKPSQLENWHPRFLQFSALSYCKEVGAGDFKVFDGHKVL